MKTKKRSRKIGLAIVVVITKTPINPGTLAASGTTYKTIKLKAGAR